MGSMFGVSVLMVLTGLMPQKNAPAPPPHPLAALGTLSCSFPVFVAPNWSTDPAEPVTKPQDFTFQIDSIDAKKRSARIVGSGGSAAAALLLTPVGLTVIEQTPAGNVNMTTVFIAGAKDGAYLAVHSRHIGDPAAPPSVSQNYGTCRAKTAPPSH